MAPRRALIKKLYKRLETDQTEDVCLTAPQLLELKFFLRNHGRCHHVKIRHSSQLDTLEYFFPENIPTFILSQLEAQRLITNSYRPSAQLWAALQVISDCYCLNPSGDQSYPTLVHWRGSNKQRGYHLFAYLDRPMASRKYKASELLDLRAKKPCKEILSRVSQNPDLGK